MSTHIPRDSPALPSFRQVLGAVVASCLACAALAQPSPSPTELDRARQLHMRGERAAALVQYRAFLEQPNASFADRATALNNVCVLLHDVGEVQKALESCEQALALRRELGDERSLARTLNNYGLALQSSGRYDEARRVYQEALRTNRTRDDSPAMAVNLANLGLLAGDEGRYGLALERHLEVEALAALHPDEPWAEEQRRVAWINRGVIYEKLGAFDQALQLYQQLVTEEEQLGPRRWATVQLNLGTVYRNLGDPHQAAAAYRRAASLFEQEEDRAGLSSARLNLGQVLHANLRRPDEAEIELRQALDLARANGDRGVEIQALFLLGELYLDRDADAARSAFDDCLELARSSGSAEGEWWSHYGLGRLAAREERLDEAVSHLDAALGVLERTRARVDDRDLRSGFLAGWRHVYEAAVDVLWQRRAEGDALEAFSLVQRAKERELVEALGVDPRSADRMGVQPILDALAELDPSGQATLLEYFVTADSPHVFRLDARDDPAQEPRWWRLENDSLARAAAVHAALASGEAPSAETLRALAHDLARAGAEGTAERLVVAPDGALRYLPFEILPDGSRRLADRHVTSYLPSASALRAPRTQEVGRYGFVGLADPEPAGADDRLFTSPFASRFTLGRLPSGRREIEDAARRLPGEHLLLTDGRATPAALRQAAVEGIRALHLAAHTVIDERPGGGAAVLLAPGSESDDGLLGPADLAQLDLRVDLTVLAACRTAVPPAGDDEVGNRGSAFGSLTGSFLAAGSDAVVATLWEVGDEATEVFMQQFYFELGRGREPATALAEVKRRLAADPRWGAPHLWSAYVLVGNASPVVDRGLAGPWVGLWLTAAGVLLVALGLVWLAATLKRRRTPRTNP